VNAIGRYKGPVMAKKRIELPELPNERDFDPWVGNLDAQSAWREFGGLSIDQAYSKFIENPLHYQERFMFMGGRAFVYYFPVLDRYLRDFRPRGGDFPMPDSDAACIAGSFTMHLLSPVAPAVIGILDKISSLTAYVREHIQRLAEDPDEQERIDSYWQIVQTQIDDTVKRESR